MDHTNLRLGNIPDEFDARDFPLYAANEFSSLSTSTSQSTAGTGNTFVLPNLPPVYNQLHIGSCVANAVCAALRYAHSKDTGKAYNEFEPSRLFVYYYARVTPDLDKMNESQPLNDANGDYGTQNRNAIHSLLMQGVCKEELWPYGNPSSDETTHKFYNLNTKPNPVEPVDWSTAVWQAKGSSHPNDPGHMGQPDIVPRSISYYRIFDPTVTENASQTPPQGWRIDLNNVPTALLEKTIQNGFPIVFGSRLYEAADFRVHVNNGVMIKPPAADKSEDVGGHAMIIVGFDSAKRLFLVQNSWGTSWPEGVTDENLKGRFWLPYEWFERNINNFPCTYDYWVIKTSK